MLFLMLYTPEQSCYLVRRKLLRSFLRSTTVLECMLYGVAIPDRAKTYNRFDEKLLWEWWGQPGYDGGEVFDGE